MDKTKVDAFSETAQIAFWMGSWYFCSLVTLFSNKYILTYMGGNVQVLGVIQMVTTATLGALKVYGPGILRGNKKVEASNSKPVRPPPPHKSHSFWKNMFYVGFMRGTTVILGLVSLSHVAVSFTETIKASAPMFTVLFARMILGEKTSNEVTLSLIPVMLGLIVCSATEWSFDFIGFAAAITNNCIDCVQNVFSKKLLREPSMTPVHLQFYTSIAAATMQIPVMVWAFSVGHHTSVSKHHSEISATGIETHSIHKESVWLWPLMLLCAVFYHLQSVTAYFTMSLISPVTQAVANTVKRSLLIFLSILHFGNHVTAFNVIGMITVMAGVGVYSYARRKYPSLPVAQEGRSKSKIVKSPEILRSRSNESFFPNDVLPISNRIGSHSSEMSVAESTLDSGGDTSLKHRVIDKDEISFIKMASASNPNEEEKVLLV